jgi:hypothetical protein
MLICTITIRSLIIMSLRTACKIIHAQVTDHIQALFILYGHVPSMYSTTTEQKNVNIPTDNIMPHSAQTRISTSALGTIHRKVVGQSRYELHENE